MFKLANLNEGDLGISDIFTNVENLSAIVPHVANILSKIEARKDNIPSYCFKFRQVSKLTLESQILVIERLLLKDISFYETDGRKVFELRGPNGGVISAIVCYLVKLPKN